MKKLLPAILFIFVSSFISCTKMDLKTPESQNLSSTEKVNPDVLQCGAGYQWDYYLGKCVPVCATGYHNDSITGACVVNGGGSGNIGPNRICSEDYDEFDLSGLTISNAVDSLGKWHNDFQIRTLSDMQIENVNLFTDSLQSFLQTKTIAFAASKGITPQNTAIPNFDLSDSLWPNTNSFSLAAKKILSNLESLVDNYTESNHALFISQCNSLKSQALNLSNENEAVCVGLQQV